MQRSTFVFLFLSLSIGFLLFQVKYAVVEIEEKLEKTLVKIRREKENIHILKAEWSHLNEPQRLQKLAEKFLDVKPAKIEQLASLEEGLEAKVPAASQTSLTRLASYEVER